VLEDSERLTATRNERLAKRMPMLFSPTTCPWSWWGRRYSAPAC
jgi:hypothetical protein